MSYAISTIQSPSCISGVAVAHIGFDAMILSRENEILISRIDDDSVEAPRIFKIFGYIKCICTFDTNKLVIILENENMICLEVDFHHLKTLFKYKPDYQIGIKLPNYLVSASNTLVIWHTRKRTCQIYNQQKNISFTQLLPFTDIYSIKCFENELQFVIVGKNLQNLYQITFFKVNDSKIDLIKSIQLNECDSAPYLLAKSIDTIYISYSNLVKTVNYNKGKLILFHSHQFEIQSLFELPNDSIGFQDEKGHIFNISNPHQLLLKLENINEIVPISHNYFLTLSSNNDSYLLKLNDSILKIVNTFAQINCASFMNRSQVITTNGRLRTFANGSATETKVVIPIKGGTHVWLVMNYIVISTFNSTLFLDKKTFSELDIDLEHDSESLLVFSTTNGIVQILPNKIIFKTTQIQELAFSEEKEATKAAYYNDMFLVVFSNKTVSLFNTVNSSIQCINSFEASEEILSISMNDSFIAMSFWIKSTIMIYSIDSLQNHFELQIDNHDETLISSLFFVDKDNLLLAGSGDGDVYVFSYENNEFIPRTKIHISSSNIQIRMLNHRIFFASDVSGFLCEGNSIEYISAPAAIDASYFNNKIAILSMESLSLLIIECSYHSHIEEEYAVSRKNLLHSTKTINTIELIAVDEQNKCPAVYAVKTETQSGSGSIYYLKAAGCSDAKLSMEKPKCMAWFYYISDYYLVVGCEKDKKGELILFNSKLEKLNSSYLDFPVDAICSVFNTYIAVACGTFLKEYLIDEDKKLQCKCSISTRGNCSSLTSPNSFAVIYASKASSVSIYMMEDDITLIAKDYHPKQLKFARMESKTDVLAIGNDSILYDISLSNENKLITTSAFNANCQISAILSSPNLAFITKGGSLKVLMKRDEAFIKLFKVMQNRIRGIGGLSIGEACIVKQNNNQFDIGKFVDGDFIVLFRELDQTLQNQIAKAVGLDVGVINELIMKYIEDVKAYREKSQDHPYFYV